MGFYKAETVGESRPEREGLDLGTWLPYRLSPKLCLVISNRATKNTAGPSPATQIANSRKKRKKAKKGTSRAVPSQE